MLGPERLRSTVALAAVVAVPVFFAGCGKSEDDAASGGSSSSGSGGGGEQVVKSKSSGSSCTPEKYAGGVPKLDLKNSVVGWAQSEKEANPFRIAETQSIKDEAKKVGVKKLLTTNAQSDLNKEISDIQDMIAQGAKVLIISPLNSEGLDPAIEAAKAKKVPVLTIDRLLTTKKACDDYIAWIGSDFVEQGKRAADAMNKATGGKANVAILLGSAGVNVTTDRTKGFIDQAKATAPGIKIVAQQTGDFTREKGQSVTEQLVQANPKIDAIYAENDEMALGAVTALKSAGKKPGKDVKVITVDGTKGAVQGIVDGEINGVIESNPRFGPLAFKTLQDFYGGTAVPDKIIIKDREYTEDNAKTELASAY